MRGRHEFVAARMNAGRNTQHHASALAETLGDFGDAGRLGRLVHHDFGEAFGNGEFDFRIGLVVAVQHESPSGNARGERDAHLAHGAGVDQHAGFGDDTADFLGKQCFSGEADMGYGVVERICRGFDEFGGAGSHVIGVDDVERRTKFVQ